MRTGTILMAMTNKRNEGSLLQQAKLTGMQVLVIEDGNTLMRTARTRMVDLVLLDEDIKGLRALDVVNILHAERIAPVILITQQPRTDYVHWMEKGWIFDYLHHSAEPAVVAKSMAGALVFGRRILEMETEILRLKKELSDRKTIERAKGIIMEMKKCSEEEAYAFLRSSSMDKKVSMEVLAQAIINKYT